MNLRCRIDSFTFPRNSRPLLQDLCLKLEQGTLTVQQGANGSGKSTLCRIICGVYPQIYEASLKGEISIDQEMISGKSLADTGKIMGVVFQDAESQLFMPSVAHEIAFGLESLGLEPAQIERRIRYWIKRLDLCALYDVNPKKCSGGEKQAIILAAVLAMDRPVVLMDEPCSQLDSERLMLFKQIISELKKQGKIILLISHQELFFSLADQHLVLINGRTYQKEQISS